MHLFIATPCYGGMLTVPYAASLLRTTIALMREGVTVTPAMLSGDSLVQRARNVQVAQFMATDADRLMFIDADISWDWRDVRRLLEATEHPEIEVACGVYPKKQMPIEFVCNFHAPGELPEMHGLIEVRDAPTGFLMLRRSGIRKMMAAYPERKCSFRPDAPAAEEPFEFALFDCPIDSDRRYLSEDYGFSRLWQAIGGRIWAHPEIRLTHHGAFAYSGCLADSLVKC